MTRAVAALLFDKDGTLYDFDATWSVWAMRMIERFSEGDPVRSQALADAARFDLQRRRFHSDSPVIAGTNRDAADCIATALPGEDVATIEQVLMAEAADAPLVEAVPLGPLLLDLRATGLRLGVMTNDSEFGARAHLARSGVAEHFDFIAGFDSGFGRKPDPGPLLAFAAAMGLDPGAVAMVGDSLHDMEAARAAGMRRVAVLTGPATQGVLAPHAEAVLPDIGHLPAWLRG